MRNIILMLVAILMIACNHSNNKKNHLQTENLKGKVKSVKETKYRAVVKFGEFVKDGKNLFGECNDEYTLYNELGNIKEKRIYDCDGKVIQKQSHTYDDIKKTSEGKIYDSSGDFLAKIIYTYDEKGNVKTSDLYNASNEELISKKIMFYDEKGNMIEQKTYNSEGNLESKVICIYDSKGNKTQEKKYDSKGNLEGDFSILYDDKGNMTQRKGYHIFESEKMSGEILFKYEYDSHNNWIKKVSYLDEKGTPFFDTLIEREIEYY